MSITASVGSSNSYTAEISPGNPIQVTRAVVPGASKTRLAEMNDFDTTDLADGALIQYDASTEKFKTTNTIETDSGTLKLSGGIY
jgi:hypothetical protein